MDELGVEVAELHEVANSPLRHRSWSCFNGLDFLGQNTTAFLWKSVRDNFGWNMGTNTVSDAAPNYRMPPPTLWSPHPRLWSVERDITIHSQYNFKFIPNALVFG
jgi:hypothetical protein